MRISILKAKPSMALARGLAGFERGFDYPMSAQSRFRISHGRDYPRYYRSLGANGFCLMADLNGAVAGTMAVVERQLLTPAGEMKRTAYFGDLKISADRREGYALLRLARAAHERAGRRCECAYSVVMNGTSVAPPDYTGRLGIPEFKRLGTINILRLRLPLQRHMRPTDSFRANPERQRRVFIELSRGRYTPIGGKPRIRSLRRPFPLMLPDSSACGVLEDTRRAKRLFEIGGGEILTGHLGAFRFTTAQSGARLLRAAAAEAAARGYKILFTAVAPCDLRALLRNFKDARPDVLSASVFGHGLEQNRSWNISTSEI